MSSSHQAKLPFLAILKDGTPLLRLLVQPGASRTGITGIHDSRIKVTVTAAPTDGKANKAVVAFLASFFKIAKKNVYISGGLHSRRKQIQLIGQDETAVRQQLDQVVTQFF